MGSAHSFSHRAPWPLSLLDTVGTKVDAIEKKPGKRWDGMVDKFLYGLVGVLAGALGAGLLYLLTVAA